MARLREDPTRKTFSLDPTKYDKWKKIQDMQGKKYSDVLEDHMDKDIEGYEKVQNKSLDLSPTANTYNAGITGEKDDDPVTKLGEVEKDVKPLMDSRNFKVLNAVLKKSRHLADWIHSFIITNTNTKPKRENWDLEDHRIWSLEQAKEYREKHTESPYQVDSKSNQEDESETKTSEVVEEVVGDEEEVVNE
jgi:hypothetical protein